MPDCTAYYEPFNERKWFDPQHRGNHVDDTHRGVSDYWREYEGLQAVDELYRESWISESLYMDVRSHDPSMRSYLQKLIDSAEGTAVLQFNRVDFRLGWLRRHFPNVPIIHLYRHPREQWLSFLKDKKLMNAQSVERSYRDAFYLDVWCRDLARVFPFLSIEETPHTYRRFYYLWKLSWLFGQRYASASLSFEDLITAPMETLQAVLADIGWTSPVDPRVLTAEISAPELRRWPTYADDSWFREHEEMCESVLQGWLPREELP
ncbi:MAG: hypothetical protein Cons2KO_30190 [Congregibacter sp.]